MDMCSAVCYNNFKILITFLFLLEVSAEMGENILKSFFHFVLKSFRFHFTLRDMRATGIVLCFVQVKVFCAKCF